MFCSYVGYSSYPRFAVTRPVTIGLAERPVAVRADQPQRQERIGLGQAGRAPVERGRRGVPPSWLQRSGRPLLPAHRHIPPQPDVRHIVPDGVRANP